MGGNGCCDNGSCMLAGNSLNFFLNFSRPAGLGFVASEERLPFVGVGSMVMEFTLV